jgi:hypothetical protein
VGTWQEVIWRLIEEHSDTAGAMMHIATPELDEGPVATYCKFAIRGPAFDPLWGDIDGRAVEELKAKEGEDNALFREIRRHGVERELPLVVATLKAFAEGKVRIEAGRIVDSEGKPIAGYDLSAEIDRQISNTLTP